MKEFMDSKAECGRQLNLARVARKKKKGIKRN